MGGVQYKKALDNVSATNLNGDLVVGEGEEVLPETVTVLLGPLLGEEVNDLLTALDERVTVAPDGIRLYDARTQTHSI